MRAPPDRTDVGALVVMMIAPAEADVPNKVLCGPLSTSTIATSESSTGTLFTVLTTMCPS